MRLFSGNYRLLGWITLILVGGFLTTSVAAYLASRDAIEHSLSEQALPLTGDLIYSGLQKDILYPVFVAELMAQDPSLRGWLAGGEQDQAFIQRYLEETRDRHGMVASFLASDASRKLYHTYGAPEPLVEGRDIDKWYFRLKSLPRAQYESSIDITTEYSGQPSLFINHRVTDANGKFVGATGVEIRLDTMNQVLARYQKRYGRNIYFVSGDGKVVLSGAATASAATLLSQRAGMRDIAPAILNRSTEPTSLSYRSGKSDVLVNSRYVPEVNWYLVVEQNTGGTISPLTRIFAINFGISFGVTLLVLVVTLLTVNRYQRKLQTIAATDALTGLLNRQALTVLFRQNAALSRRSGRPLAAILFDIDHFKAINDNFGHMAGDTVIRQVAQLALDAVRASDVVTRWGGEEYLVLLGDCNLSQAMAIAENLRLRVAEHGFGLRDEHVVTISLGVAQLQEDETEEVFFARVDNALYAAKHRGRNVASASHPATLAHQLF